MLKKINSLFAFNGWAIGGKHRLFKVFSNRKCNNGSEHFNAWEVDELVFLDINRKQL